ncbi:TPA: hypothetical protein PZ174_000106 [Staphylococcus aureus]|nr:hypothetical protein [Staphylococcus aureus]AVT86411.1 hypothetical protein CPC18_00970 [Staphylococcus aureus]EJX2043038.1 hypothetical protein [Staphylococcus aureus]EKF1458315.1 hypothetical protein [Staphylococcus aureus]EKF1526869.1 hypothetical protein [Staphylococcus aureus]EKK3046000.1 hypothetical protein [Staphylococcus aureus]
MINVGDLWDNEHNVYNHWGGLDINDYRSTY